MSESKHTNALLIAAAPELLAALKALVAAVDNVEEDSLYEMRDARAAIDKAEGKQ